MIVHDGSSSFPVVHASGNCGGCAGVIESVHLLSGLCVYCAVVGLLLSLRAGNLHASTW